VGVAEKVVLDDATLRTIEDPAKDAGKTIDDEVVELVRLGLLAAESRQALMTRARLFRESLPPQTTDSLTLLRENRDR